MKPRFLRVSKFSWTARFSYIFTFMAGQMITGARVARITFVRSVSAMPEAVLPIKLAVAGATTIRSALSARLMCPISDSQPRSKVFEATRFPERV